MEALWSADSWPPSRYSWYCPTYIGTLSNVLCAKTKAQWFSYDFDKLFRVTDPSLWAWSLDETISRADKLCYSGIRNYACRYGRKKGNHNLLCVCNKFCIQVHTDILYRKSFFVYVFVQVVFILINGIKKRVIKNQRTFNNLAKLQMFNYFGSTDA